MMLPRLNNISPVQGRYLKFIEALAKQGFRGEMSPDYATRIITATDNSIYQVLPQATVFPRDKKDLQHIAGLAGAEKWQDIVLSPRGGGTGTNGQSLTDGIVVDLSRHMNNILEINVKERWARVEAGVVKDQLNAALACHGLFFAPELSTSNRATIGGMINTDASGQGSVMYGKTRDHVLELTTVLMDGEALVTAPLEPEAEASLAANSGIIGEAHRTLIDIYQRRDADIKARFPVLNRCLTGYDLAHIRDEQGRLNLNSILCGSEGTLGFIAEARLNLVRIPTHQALVVVRYDSFEASLRDARALLEAEPTSIETIDSKLLSLARNDISWSGVSGFFQADPGEQVDGVNLIEYTADTTDELEAGIRKLTRLLDKNVGSAGKALGYAVAVGQAPVSRIWALRKRAVGLLGNTPGEARPVAFVEDTAVPPENLADFIMAFRQVLDREGLSYGMFGHVDAGVLHVRPALDLKDPETIVTIRRVSEEVVELVNHYGGLLWGEHGKGFRSEFTPRFFSDLYPELQAVKRAFDPRNQLNPGKIATTDQTKPLTPIDGPKLRGDYDRKIPLASWEHQKEAVYCNGNGACFNFDHDDAMCPSWKGTRDRKHSPKGRASLVREWTRILGEQDLNTRQLADSLDKRSVLLDLVPRIRNTLRLRDGEYDFSKEVFDSMAGCLACKSCTGQCPVKVDVPEFRAKFLHLYHGRYLRPLKDYLIGNLENVLPLLANPIGRRLYNGLISSSLISRFLRLAGMVDSPLLHRRSPATVARELGIQRADEHALQSLAPEEKARSVIIVQDAFTSFLETDTFASILECLQKLGFQVWLMPYRPNGKPLHVQGFLKQFTSVANRRQQELEKLAGHGVPLVGIDPSMTLAYRSEYPKYVTGQMTKVLLLQEFLGQKIDYLQTRKSSLRSGSAKMMGHCTEKTNAPASMHEWTRIYSALGQSLTQEPVGCCGMAGTYGHETRNRETSEKIYDLSWRDKIASAGQEAIIATGYSCRSQVSRLQQKRLLHPLEFLLSQMEARPD